MEKRALIAVVFSILILVVWFGYVQPPQRPPEAPPQDPAGVTEGAEAQRDPAGVRPDRPDPSTAESVPAGAEARPDDAEAGIDDETRVVAEVEESIVVKTNLFEAELSNRGGRIVSWRLLQFASGDNEPPELLPRFQDAESLYLSLDLDDPVLTEEANAALYQVERETLFSDGERGGGERITFSYADGRGLTVRKALEFREDEYLVDVDVEAVDRGRARPVVLMLGPGFTAQAEGRGRSNYYYDAQILVNNRGEVSRVKRRQQDAEQAVGGQIRWAGLEDQYFTALVVPREPVDLVAWQAAELTELPSATDEEAPKPERQAIVAVQLPPEGTRIFLGPKNYRQLRDTGYELEKSVWFSSYGWLRPIVKGLFMALLWIHDNVTGNYGLAIILATVVLRLLLFPLNQYAMVNMKKQQLQMQKLQPKMKAIKAKYKKKDAQTRAKVNQETMELYKKEGVNPAGGLTGCLPLLGQFPILIGFYNMLTVAIELRGAPFFAWITDLSLKDPLYITPLLMGATMFAQQKMAMSKIKDPQQLQQQRMMLFMPLMFTVICVQMPSGLVLYWFVNNLLGIAQQWLVNKQTNKLAEPAPKAKTKKTRLDS